MDPSFNHSGYMILFDGKFVSQVEFCFNVTITAFRMPSSSSGSHLD